MFALDLFNNDHERRLAEGAVDQLEQRRIDDLAMKMDDLVARAKKATTPEVKAALVKEFQKCKDERDSYYKIRNETMGYGSLTAEAGIPGSVPTEKIPGKEDLLKGKGRSYYEATGDDKFDTMMGRISRDPWTQLNSDPDWQYEIEELVDQNIEPFLATMEKSNIPITMDNKTLNPAWRKRYEQVSTQLAQKYLASKKFNPRDPDLVNKIRAYIDWFTNETSTVHGQLDAYASDLPLQLHLDTPGADEKIADIRANMFPNNQDEEDDDGYAIRPRPEADPRRLDPGNIEENDDWYDEEDEETDLRTGDYVRDQLDGEHGEVFRMVGDPYERRVRILDRDDRGWYIEPSRLTRVDPTDPDVQRYFGKKRVRDMDEAAYTGDYDTDEKNIQHLMRKYHWTRQEAEEHLTSSESDDEQFDEDKWDPWTGGDFSATHDMNHLPDDDAGTDPNKTSAGQFKAMIQYYGNNALVRRALDDLYRVTVGSGYDDSVISPEKYLATLENQRTKKTQKLYFKSKQDAHRYAKGQNAVVTNLVKIDNQEDTSDLITLPVVLGLADHKKKWMLKFPSEDYAQKWEFKHKNAAKIQWPSGHGLAEAGAGLAITTDAKGRTQQEWIKLVRAKFPTAKIQQAKMIDGPVFAILPDGRKLSWKKVEKETQAGIPGSVPTEKIPGKEDLLKGQGRKYYESNEYNEDDYEQLLNAIAALYGPDIWNNDAMGDLANDLEQANPTPEELNFIIKHGKLPKRLQGIKFTNNDTTQFGEAAYTGDYDTDEKHIQHLMRKYHWSRQEAEEHLTSSESDSEQFDEAIRPTKKLQKKNSKQIKEAGDPTGQIAVYNQGLEIPVASQYTGDGQFKVTVKNKPYIATVAGFEIDPIEPGKLDSFYLTDVKNGKTHHITGAWDDPVAVAIFNNLQTNQKAALRDIYKQDMAFYDKHDWDGSHPERLQGLDKTVPSGYNSIPADRFIKAHDDMKKVTGQDVDESSKSTDPATDRLLTRARREYPRARSDAEALAMKILGKEQADVARLDQVNNREDRMIDKLADLEKSLQQQIDQLKQSAELDEGHMSEIDAMRQDLERMNDRQFYTAYGISKIAFQQKYRTLLKPANIDEHGGGIGPKQHWQDLMRENKLSVGDPVVVTGANEFEGKTGEIDEFSPSGTFVIVNLYNHGKHSMHLSDVEYNQYADTQDEEDDWYDDQEDTLEGWSNKMVAQRTGQAPTPYSVYIKGKEWKSFPDDDHAENIANKLRAKFKQEGRDPSVITIAATGYDKMSEEQKPYNPNEFRPVGPITIVPPKKLKSGETHQGINDYWKAHGQAPIYKTNEEGKGTPVPAKDFIKGVLKDLKKVNVKEQGVAEAQLAEATSREILLGLLDKFYADMKLPPRQGSHTGALDIKSPGTKVWTRGDGTRLRDPGRIQASHWADDKKQAEKAASKFWPWLLKQPGVKSIGQVSGQFGSSPMTDAVSYKGLYFSGGPYGTEFGSMSRVKNPKSVWRHKPFELEPKAEQGVAESASDSKNIIAKLMKPAFVDGSGGNFSYMLELKAPTMHSLREKYHDDLDAMFAHASKEELAQAAEELKALGWNPQEMDEGQTDYSKRRQRERDVDAGKPVAKQRQSKMTDYQKRRAQQKKEMELGEESSTSSDAVERAILNRIMTAHTDLLMKFGPQKVMQAAEEVAYNVGDVDEIGTSDVSAYVAQVKQILGVPEELDEKWSQKYKSSINCSNPKGFSQKAHCAGKKK